MYGAFFRQINTFPRVRILIVQMFQKVPKSKLIFIDHQTQIFSLKTLSDFFTQNINRNLYSCTGDFASKNYFETWFRNLIRKRFQSVGVFLLTSTFKSFFPNSIRLFHCLEFQIGYHFYQGPFSRKEFTFISLRRNPSSPKVSKTFDPNFFIIFQTHYSP